MRLLTTFTTFLLATLIMGPTAFDRLKGNDLYVVARNLIQVDQNAQILLGGDDEGYWSGEIYFEGLRNGNQITIDNGAAFYGRKIRIINYGGSIRVDGESRLTGRPHIRLQTYAGDIELSHGASISTSSPDGKCWVTLKARTGDLYLSDNVSIAADVINLCPIEGDIYDDGTTLMVGRTRCW